MDDGHTNSDEKDEFLQSKEVVGVESAIINDSLSYMRYLEDDTTRRSSPAAATGPVSSIVGIPAAPVLTRQPTPPHRHPGAFRVSGSRIGGAPPEEESHATTIQNLPQANHVPANHNGLAQATPVPEEDPLPADMMEAQPFDVEAAQNRQSRRKTLQRKTVFCLAMIPLCAIVAIVVTLGYSGHHNGEAVAKEKAGISSPKAPSGSPSLAPLGNLDLLLDRLPNYTLVALEQFSTPQWKIYQT